MEITSKSFELLYSMLSVLIVIVGLAVLLKSSEILVDQASSLAKKLKLDDFIIGFTIVAFGTSLPELTSAIFSSTYGQNNLVVSGIIGSNIANLCLIFGIMAIGYSYKLRKRDVDINIPLNFAALTAFWSLAVFVNFKFEWWTGIILIMVFGALILLSKEYNHVDLKPEKYVKFNLLTLLVSGILLIMSGKVVIDQIIQISVQMKISQTILGYFILAAGTSLPELVTTWMAVKKDNNELGVGSILGSNLFNLLFVFGTATFIHPIDLKNFTYDLVFLTVVTFSVYAFAVLGKKYYFSRKEGIVLVGMYVLFAVFQILRAV